MTVFLTLGVIGIVLLLAALVIGDHVDGIFDALGGGDWLTGAALAGFLGALGFMGALVLSLTDSPTIATVLGAGAGLAVGAGVGWITLRLRHSGEGTTPRSSTLVGLTGTVINAIPVDGYGEISVTNGGHLTKLNAKAAEAVPSGTVVTITDLLSPTSVAVRVTYR